MGKPGEGSCTRAHRFLSVCHTITALYLHHSLFKACDLTRLKLSITARYLYINIHLYTVVVWQN